MSYFAIQWSILLIGLVLHVIFDRSSERRTARRVLTLTAVWFVVVGLGVNGAMAGLVHIGPGAAQAAASIGWAPSPFQWENGVSDLAVGVAALACAWRRFRGPWMSAVIVIALIQLWGDGIQHITQLAIHGNTAVDNVGAIPTCFAVPAIAGIATIAARRADRAAADDSDGAVEPTGHHAAHRVPA